MLKDIHDIGYCHGICSLSWKGFFLWYRIILDRIPAIGYGVPSATQLGFTCPLRYQVRLAYAPAYSLSLGDIRGEILVKDKKITF